MQTHAVHGDRRTPGNRETSRHIILRFICRKDRDFVWSQREATKKTKLQRRVFVNLVTELAEEGFKRSNRFVMLDSGFSYTVKDIPEYIKKEIYKGRQSAPQS